MCDTMLLLHSPGIPHRDRPSIPPASPAVAPESKQFREDRSESDPHGAAIRTQLVVQSYAVGHHLT